MAELILGSVVSSITEQATSLISREIGGALGAKDELKKLWDTVQAIKAVLAEAERRQVQDKAIRDWLKKVSGAVYEADDLLDDYSTEIKRRRLMEGNPNNRMMKELRTFFSSFNRVLYNFKMADRVKSIRETLNTINQNKEKYNLGEDNTGNAPHNQIRDYMEKKKERDDDPYFCQSHLFGRDDDSKKICTRLFNDSTSDENVSVIPIIGIGGLGKTALAKQIYNDEKVDKHFSLKFWVCVSHNFDEKIILKKILQQYVQQCDGIKKVEEDCRADELRKKIEGKKYLLVLDDVWNENRGIWLNLENYLKNGARGSKILVTARSESVVKIMTRDIPYRLEGLFMENSVALRMKMAHKKEDEWKNQILEEIGREIVSKCGKVPLAIMTIGSLLCYKDTEKDWKIFNSQEFAGIKQETDDILPTLKLSYDILPSPLKQCFTYCSLFPKNYELSPIKLIDLWMAQGFLHSANMGHDYFMKLVRRSFFQDIEKDVYGNVITCKMHDLMHDLAQKEAGSNFAVVDNSNTTKYRNGEVLHVSIYKDKLSKWVGEKHTRARSLLCFEGVKEDFIKVISKNFRNTRVLWLTEDVQVVPKEIGKFNHLRSLNLSNSTFEVLPRSISKLCNLETLNLQYCRKLIKLPRGIIELVNLRHLNIKGCSELIHMPKGIEKLTKLETLSDFIVGEEGKDDVAGLDELSWLSRLANDLRLSHLERLGKGRNGSFPIKSLNLPSLELCWDAKGDKQVPTHSEEQEEEAILDRLHPRSHNLKGLILRGYMGCTLSPWFSELHKLAVLRIENCKYCKQLPPIHQLPLLKSLKLKYLIDLEYIVEGNMNSAFFPSLHEIGMFELPTFKGWVNLQGNNSQGKEFPEEGDDDLLLPVFPTVFPAVTREQDTRRSYIRECPAFSYIGREGHVSLMNVEERYIHKWLRNNQVPFPEEVPLNEEVNVTPSFRSCLQCHSVPFQDEVPLNEEVKATPSFRFLSSVPITKLKSLYIGGFEGTTWRAIMKRLPFLEILKISNCSEIDLTSVLLEGEVDQQLQHDHTSSKIKEEVVIKRVERMTSLPWWFQHLSELKILKIRKCDGLKSLWRDRKLDLNGADMDILELSMLTTLRELAIHDTEAEFLPWWVGHLRNLEKLSFRNWENMKALPEYLCNLTSLQELKLFGCKSLQSLSRKTIIHLISTLQKWKIKDCQELDLNGELDVKDDTASNAQLMRMSVLHQLAIQKNKAEYFPWWVEHLKNLKSLSISEWDNLKALPEWLCKLTSLTWLSINACPHIKRERCKKKGEEDGAKIAHIKDVYVNDEWYRRDGQWMLVAR